MNELAQHLRRGQKQALERMSANLATTTLRHALLMSPATDQPSSSTRPRTPPRRPQEPPPIELHERPLSLIPETRFEDARMVAEDPRTTVARLWVRDDQGFDCLCLF